MGMVFNSAETMRLCARLNRRFSENRLDQIRNDPMRLAKYLNADANHRTLARIAYKSGTYPGNARADKVAKRWFYFLQNLPVGVSLAIKEALENGLTTQAAGTYKYESLLFTAYESNTIAFTPIDLPVVDANGNQTGSFSLLFSLQTAAVDPNDVYDPGKAADDGEDPHEPDDGPPDTDSGTGSVPLKKKAAKKKAAKKKVAKKKAAKKKKA